MPSGKVCRECEKKEWNALLDPARFYDAKKRQVINLPENYLGVAARVAAMSWQMGVLKDRAFLDSVVERAAEQFTKGAIYSDDNPPTGRYDRYSNEYARFCWDAAEIAGRKDILEKLKPSLKEQMKLWWDLVSPQGYGYNWGRSQGLVVISTRLKSPLFSVSIPNFVPRRLKILPAFTISRGVGFAPITATKRIFLPFSHSGAAIIHYINPQTRMAAGGNEFRENNSRQRQFYARFGKGKC